MKNLSLILNAILFIAVAILFFMVFSGRSNNNQNTFSGAHKTDSVAGIAYINTDSLLLKYDFARRLNETLLKKEENSRADFNEQARIFQEDMMSFQRKVKNNAFLTLERAQSEERTLRQKEQQLQELNNKLSNDLMQQQGQMNQQLRDTIAGFLESYVKKHPYQIILSNTLGDNILYGQKSLDITNSVVEQLNDRYRKATIKK
jgi:outer membrane protein